MSSNKFCTVYLEAWWCRMSDNLISCIRHDSLDEPLHPVCVIFQSFKVRKDITLKCSIFLAKLCTFLPAFSSLAFLKKSWYVMHINYKIWIFIFSFLNEFIPWKLKNESSIKKNEDDKSLWLSIIITDNINIYFSYSNEKQYRKSKQIPIIHHRVMVLANKLLYNPNFLYSSLWWRTPIYFLYLP